MTNARLTQQAAETLLAGTPSVRSTQQAAETLLTGTPLARATLVATEVLHSTAQVSPPPSERRPVVIICVTT
jgi:Mg-chelatase subunit ChlD